MKRPVKATAVLAVPLVIALGAMGCFRLAGAAADDPAASGALGTPRAEGAKGHPLEGEWHYRAYFNDPEKGSTAGFGEGTLTIKSVNAEGSLTGTLEIRDGKPEQNFFAPLSVTGRVALSHPVSLRFRGKGTGKRANKSSNEDWLYDYQGYRLTDDIKIVAPMDRSLSPEEEAKLGRGPVMVGQVIRVKDHPSDGPEPERAGQVGTWIAVKRSGK